MSNADQIQVAVLEEVTWGVTPSANFQLMRVTSESLSQETSTANSAELRPDRQLAGIVRTNVTAGGEMAIEFSYGTFDELLAAGLFAAAWIAEVTVTLTDLSMDDSDNSINTAGGDFVASGYVINQWINVTGFTTNPLANNGLFKIVSVVVGKMVLSNGTVITEAAGASVTAKQGEYIENGVTERSFTIEKNYTDLGSNFALYKGMEVSDWSLSAAVESILTGGFTFTGQKENSATSSPGTGYDPATTTEVMNGVDNITAIKEGNVDFEATEFTIAMSNNLRARSVLGTLGAISLGAGTINVTGTLKAFYETQTLIDKYLNFDSSSLTIQINDSAGNQYVIDIPEVKYSTGTRVAGGQNSDILQDMAWSGVISPTEGKTIRITRFPAI